MKYYVLLTGSREATEDDRCDILEALVDFGGSDQIEFVHGGCRGADSICSSLIPKMGYTQKVFLPDHGNWPKAGPERNRRMVEYVKEMASNNHKPVCIAFLKPGFENKGTLGCIGMALRAGFRVDITVLRD